MEKVIAPENTPPVAGNPSVTPAAVVPTAEDPATELARLRQEKIEADKRLAEKDKHIGELSTEKATLENRLSGYQAVESVIPQTQPEGEEGQDPAKPKGQHVGAYVRPEDVPEIIERTTFITEMKKENKDMMDFGLEPVITMRADQLIRTGKSFKEAVATAVKEQREKFDKIKQPTTPAQTPSVPAGLQGEAGASVPVTPTPVKEDSLGDEGEERRRLRAKRGL